MNKITKRQKTVKDFIEETTFKPDSVKDSDYFFSAYHESRPYAEKLDDLLQIVNKLYEKDNRPSEMFWDFTTNLFHTFREFDNHILLKNSSIEEFFGFDSDTDVSLNVMLDLESSIAPIYYTGSKCARYLLDNFTNGLTQEEQSFLYKYIGTRNKIFEHNLNPSKYPFVIEIFHLSLFSTDSELDMQLINYKNQEIEESGFIDYYDDNYKLIDICIKYLKSIS